MNRRVLLISQSPYLNTGFATLSRRIGYYLHQKRDITVVHCAISDPRPNDEDNYNQISIPWKVYKYRHNYQRILKAFKPHIVIILVDLWSIGEFMQTDSIKVALVHIEGEPLPVIIAHEGKKVNIPKDLLSADYIVTAGEYGDRVVRERLLEYVNEETLNKKMVAQIPDCINLDIFKPLNGNWKKKLFGLDKKVCLMGWFGRQNARKGIPYVLKALGKWEYPHKKLYIHTAIKDIYGWDLHQMAKDYGVSDNIITDDRLKLTSGVTELEMVKLYNAMDFTVQPSLGEGFGLCVGPNTEIITQNGATKIKDIEIRKDWPEKTIAEDGCYHSILAKTERVVDEYYEVIPWGYDKIQITKEHPFLVTSESRYMINKGKFNTEWKNVTELSGKEFLVTPIPKSNPHDLAKHASLNLYSCLSDETKEKLYYDESQEHLYFKMGFSSKNKISYSYIMEATKETKKIVETSVKLYNKNELGHTERQKKVIRYLQSINYEHIMPKKIKASIKLTKQFFRLAGWYLAEGSTGNNNGSLEFDLCGDEMVYAIEIKQSIKDIFGLDATIAKRKTSNVLRITCSNKIIAEFFAREFGSGAENKRIPSYFSDFNPIELAAAWFQGDGGSASNGISGTTISRNLAWGIWKILLAHKLPSRVKLSPSRNNNKPAYTIQMSKCYLNKLKELTVLDISESKKCETKREGSYHIISNEYMLTPIRSIKHIKDPLTVYDIEVEGVHSFVGNGVTLHNTVAEAIACGTPVIINDYSELKRFKPACEVVQPAAYYIEPRTNIERAVPDVDAIVDSMEKLRTGKRLQKILKTAGGLLIKDYSVDRIGKKWYDFIKKVVEEKATEFYVFPTKKLVPKKIKTLAKRCGPVSIIIPTKDNIEDLQRCIISIQKNTQYPHEMVIVDSKSKADVRKYYEELKNRYDNIKIIEREGKHNYSDECNIGVKHSTNELICIMNDDVFVENNWLVTLVEEIEAEDIGIVGSKLLFEDGRIQHAGVKLMGENFAHPYIGEDYNYTISNFTRDVSGVTGALFLTKTSLWNKVDGMDTNMDVECQDFDYCLKVHSLGYRNIYCPHSKAVHLVASNRGNKWPNKILANRKLFLNKWKSYLFNINLKNRGPEGLLISVIVPVYNCAEYIKPFLESVQSQTYENFEIIAVDDKSTDDSLKILREYEKILPNMKVITHEKNMNANVARTTGFAVSKGNFIIFSDVDSKWRPVLLERMLNELLINPGMSYAYSDHKREGFINDTWNTIPFNRNLITKTNFINMISLIRREHFPGLDPKMERAQDWDLWLTMMKNGHIGKHIKEVLYTLYMRVEGISGRGDKDWEGWREKVLDKFNGTSPKDYTYTELISDLTIVMAIKNLKNRGFERLHNNLSSLETQTVIPKEVIIMDGSNKEQFEEGKRYTKKFDFVTHINCPLDIFNKPLLYNIALRGIKTKYSLMTDADYIYEPDFVDSVIKSLKENGNRFVLCQTRDLPEKLRIVEKTITEDYMSLKRVGEPHPLYGDGACQASKTEWFKKVRGYDERMALLGGMDNDMHRRAERDNLEVLWVQDKTSILHQWHEKTKWRTPEQLAQHAKNKKIYNEDKSIVRNELEWGNYKGEMI